MKLNHFILAAGCVFLINLYTSAQTGLPAYADNALKYNKLMMEKTGDGVYKLVGTYKVVGNSYLFGQQNKGNIFSPGEKAYNISLSYNTYNQEVEFYSASNPNEPLIKEAGSLDSFVILPNIDREIVLPLKFVYGSVLGVKDKYYFLEIYKGKRFSLYKRYRSELGYVSTNYVQSELRQFDLEYEYYYSNTEKKGLKKIKSNQSSVVQEFKEIKDLSSAVSLDDFAINPEAALVKAFENLNN